MLDLLQMVGLLQPSKRQPLPWRRVASQKCQLPLMRRWLAPLEPALPGMAQLTSSLSCTKRHTTATAKLETSCRYTCLPAAAVTW